MFWRLPQNLFSSVVRLQLVQFLERTLIHKFATSFSDEGNTQADADSHKAFYFWTFALLESVARRPVFFSPRTRTFRGCFTQGIPPWKTDGREPFPFPSDSRFFSGSCFIQHFLNQSTDLSSPTVHNVSM